MNEKRQGTLSASHDNELLASETAALEVLHTNYNRLVLIDTKIKNSYWRGTAEQWESALDEAERVIKGAE